MKKSLIYLLSLLSLTAVAQQSGQVNVFLGSSGDNGQMSPAASYPFSMVSIGPETYPSTHTGYEYYAKEFLGFTHNRMEGVGCQGCGGNLLLRPFLGDGPVKADLIKYEEQASPGYYHVGFTNGIKASFTVYKNAGLHQYTFPEGKKGLLLDLGFAHVGRFVAEEHTIEGNAVSGWVESRTTCSAGIYRVYYYVETDRPVKWTATQAHELVADVTDNNLGVRIGLSSVNATYAKAAITKDAFDMVKVRSEKAWNDMLGHIKVKGDPAREKLFYSLFYRSIQSPYVVSEPDGAYAATNGTLQHTNSKMYNGWAIWDNYRAQLPLLSIAFPQEYQDMTNSIAGLYAHGKKDYATLHEPSITVRTEHAVVVLLDALKKGYKFDFNAIADSVEKEIKGLDYAHPDKALESSYDAWALAELYYAQKDKAHGDQYKVQAADYKKYWLKDFQDLTKRDVDRMQARGLYQGTIWQYRWFVPFDLKGLMELCGGEQAYLSQLDEFFDNDYYCHANQPDLQTPFMYNVTNQPWKSQALVHKIAVDTMVQHYFNDNSRGIGSEIGPIYKNQPAAYVRTMDDDAGTMSSWFVLVSTGIFPACIGSPVYYLNVPLFESVEWQWPGAKPFSVQVKNFGPKNVYIKEVWLNGRKLDRNWITHSEIAKGGKLEIVASDQPDMQQGLGNKWIADITRQ
ncbi:glycoside hydrolase domain-containing protein [Chitinophaga pinensis]|uniref:Alpha-1,2-mannosidase n=1 Tax=Chitinophaga pinensis (strain ATCC 43595 / DSM 2588 / LMG 13176 / NBRC 15968 / NCIMB 11800 / UQM 2034) TaxID=485918 RepID=A0A979G0D9_CHIPD|nr:glycoside hydrolase domain-containing protein [Chitinophaga pinensis]ACU58463.1 alpha-1,2-mannosidase [Chitinophaga pinensis DSM 2588]